MQIKVAQIDYFLYIYILENKRRLYFYKEYFREFYRQQSFTVQKKILWTLKIIESLDRIPEIYFKHLENTDALYEIRIQVGSNIFRIFCFFDDNNMVVIGNGFQKKTQKTPVSEITRAEKIKNEYYEEKESYKS